MVKYSSRWPRRRLARKIARALGGRGHKGDLACRSRPNPCALVGSEEEELIFLNRAADGCAVLVALERILRGSEKVSRIHIPVAHKFERATVERVGS
jgi:hypothetical protein